MSALKIRLNRDRTARKRQALRRPSPSSPSTLLRFRLLQDSRRIPALQVQRQRIAQPRRASSDTTTCRTCSARSKTRSTSASDSSWPSSRKSTPSSTGSRPTFTAESHVHEPAVPPSTTTTSETPRPALKRPVRRNARHRRRQLPVHQPRHHPRCRVLHPIRLQTRHRTARPQTKTHPVRRRQTTPARGARTQRAIQPPRSDQTGSRRLEPSRPRPRSEDEPRPPDLRPFAPSAPASR